eukprot:TRINITY_DN14267_c0_g1_i1.p1 TRINITY_DN14267_c0_g1~~TRINITY_DN14267_c0_g1_i1.p1  ORF type:complete len:272 (+),score=10.82 TRINITY_DN14267_c0_g1_i1:98-913(+)
MEEKQVSTPSGATNPLRYRRMSFTEPEFVCPPLTPHDGAISMGYEDVGGEVVFDEYSWSPYTPHTAPESPWQNSLGSHAASVMSRDIPISSLGFQHQYLTLFPNGMDEIPDSVSGSTSTFCDSSATSAEDEEHHIAHQHMEECMQNTFVVAELETDQFGVQRTAIESTLTSSGNALDRAQQPHGSRIEQLGSAETSQNRQKLSRLLWQSMRIRNANGRTRGRRVLSHSMPEISRASSSSSEQELPSRGRGKKTDQKPKPEKSWIFVEEKPS